MDHSGNRVAAMTYGPDRVLIIVGINKVVPEAGLAVSLVLFVIGIYAFARFRHKTMELIMNKGALNEQ